MSSLLQCRRCWTRKPTTRIKKIYEEYHKDTNIELAGPTGIDYSVGNLCNLKCVICGPTNSSQWVPDFQKLHPTIDIAPFQYKKNEQLEIVDTDLLKNIKLGYFNFPIVLLVVCTLMKTFQVFAENLY